MFSILGLGVFAVGIVLLIFGFNETQSFSSDVSRLFTGNPTDHSIWMLIGGIALVIAGLALAFRATRGQKG